MVAVSPVIRARHAETAFAVTCVVGIFLGTAIHDTSQVIGAALISSQQANAPAALAAASVAKLLRNLSIAVIVPTAAWLVQRHEAQSRGTPADDPVVAPTSCARPPLVPLFVLAFIGFIAVRSAGDALYGASAPLWQALINTG